MLGWIFLCRRFSIDACPRTAYPRPVAAVTRKS
jgi:hypothetical protein